MPGSGSDKYEYIIHVKMPDDSVKRFGYPIPTNTWVLAGEKMKLAEEYGVDPNNVIVHHRDHGAIL